MNIYTTFTKENDSKILSTICQCVQRGKDLEILECHGKVFRMSITLSKKEAEFISDFMRLKADMFNHQSVTDENGKLVWVKD